MSITQSTSGKQYRVEKKRDFMRFMVRVSDLTAQVISNCDGGLFYEVHAWLC